ncbi:hypothetical protein [Halocatena halophila]|uniref:hypothetical protein n=1 Tax=Halocatena halophila TaxID=2814576 RepID=UPI002ED66E47
MATDPDYRPIDLREMLREGVYIAVILIFWSTFAFIGIFGVANIGYSTESLFSWLGNTLGLVFAITGIGNALIYVIVRGQQLSEQ